MALDKDIVDAIFDIRDQLVGVPDSSPNTLQLAVSSVAPTVIAFSNPNRSSILIRNTGSSTIYIGNSSVTVDTGLPLLIDDVLVLDKTKGEIYGISEDIDGVVAVLEE